MSMDIRFAVPPAVAPLSRSIQSPAESDVFWSVALQAVTPSRPAVPAVLLHANPPDAAVARAELVRWARVPAWFLDGTAFGVPPSAATMTSTTVAAYGI